MKYFCVIKMKYFLVAGLLDVTVSSVLSREKFTHDMVIACEVSLPGTPHYVREELTTFQHSSKFLN